MSLVCAPRPDLGPSGEKAAHSPLALEVRVYGEPDLSGAFRVSPEGAIDYPFCGRVRAAGLSSGGLVDRLTDCLKGGYLKNPQVTVFLKEFNSKKVFVFGEVQKPVRSPSRTGCRSSRR